MTNLYLDLFTNLIFLLLVGYLVKYGLPQIHGDSSPYLLKFNQLIQRNYWLFALPYFYAISLMNDFESLFGLKSYAIQIVYFLLFTGIHLLILLRIQNRSVIDYFLLLKSSMGKFRLKFFKVNQKKEMNGEGLLIKNQAIKITFLEFDFLMNSFGLPLLFALTNAYFITKILFLVLKSQ
jgi:hypothetical protein